MSLLATQLGVEPRFASTSGDAQSDVDGWLGSVLANENRSAAANALRASLTASAGSNVALTELELFSYYRALLTIDSPADIWPGALVQWCRADMGASAGVWPDFAGGAGYLGSSGFSAADATLNNLPTLSTNGLSQSLASPLSLPQASARDSTLLTVAKFGAFAGTLSYAIDSADNSHFCSIGAANATQCFFANGGTNLTLNMNYGQWSLFRSDYSAQPTDLHTAGPNSRGGSAQNQAPSIGRVVGPATNGQRIDWFELIWLSGIPSKADLFLYKGYLDALTAGSVAHT